MQSSRKQPSRRLEKRENSRRWLLIPALCAAVILAVVLIVELNKQPQVLPDNSNTTPVSHDQPTTPDPEPEPDPEPIPELLTLVNPWNQVPEDWTVTDVQLYPTERGPALLMAVQTLEGDRLSIFLQRRTNGAPEQPDAIREGAQSVAYWRRGDMSYALVGESEPGEMDARAEVLARTWS